MSEPTDAQLLQTWERGASRETWKKALKQAHAMGESGLIAQIQLDHLPTSLQALTANAALVRKMTGQRWFVIRDARESGDSWEDIATALDLTVDETVAYYRRSIAAQEKYCTESHETARSRAVLPEGGKDTRGDSRSHAGESTQPDDGDGQEREALLLTWDRAVDLPDGGTAEAYVICRTPDGGRAELILHNSEQRAALASLLDIQWVDIRERCGTDGCGTLEDLDPSDPVLWGWVRLQVAAVDDAPRWWCSAMCAWSAMARAGEELAAQDRAAADDIGGDL